MSWALSLYETYKNCSSAIGIPQNGGLLAPVAHAAVDSHVVVDLDANGNLRGAKLLHEYIIVPCTQESASRLKANAPYPLTDTLLYLTGERSTKGKDARERHEDYIKQLKEWCEAEPHFMTAAVLTYLEKNTLVDDLIRHNILKADPNGKLAYAMKKQTLSKELKKITDMAKLVVRFTVDGTEEENRTWMNESLRENYTRYNAKRQDGKKKIVCYASGREDVRADFHYVKMTNMPNARLISGNDDTGLTYRGRAEIPSEAANIGCEASQRIHNTLRWLIKSRGSHCGSQTVIAWALCGKKLVNPFADTDDLLGAVENITDADKRAAALSVSGYTYAQTLNKALLSKRCCNLTEHEDVAVMALDSANQARIAITYYREMKGGEFLEQVVDWHNTCVWRFQKDKRSFTGAPSLMDIAKAAYGADKEREDGQKVINATIRRLMPCIFERAPLPPDIVTAAVNRASNPMAIDRKKEREKHWEWEWVLSVACALYNKQHEKEEFDVALDETRNDRDYLYGRLLAVADWVESTVLRWQSTNNRQERPTNAMRYMSAFAQRPLQTWMNIDTLINPYEMAMELKTNKYKKLKTKIISQFLEGDFEKQQKLGGAFLLGFHNQRQQFFDEAIQSKDKEDHKDESDE